MTSLRSALWRSQVVFDFVSLLPWLGVVVTEVGCQSPQRAYEQTDEKAEDEERGHDSADEAQLEDVMEALQDEFGEG